MYPYIVLATFTAALAALQAYVKEKSIQLMPQVNPTIAPLTFEESSLQVRRANHAWIFRFRNDGFDEWPAATRIANAHVVMKFFCARWSNMPT